MVLLICFYALSGWQPRWFVLEVGVLAYYKSQEEVGLGSRGSVKMACCEISGKSLTYKPLRYIEVHKATRWTIRDGLMLQLLRVCGTKERALKSVFNLSTLPWHSLSEFNSCISPWYSSSAGSVLWISLPKVLKLVKIAKWHENSFLLSGAYITI